jgi:putative sterol carrier protein
VSSAAELKAIFSAMEKRFKPNVLDKETSFYFSLGEGPGEKWSVVVGPTSCKITEGKPEKEADCFLKTKSSIFIDMISGRYKPGITDFMTGKIKSNDPIRLKSLMSVFGAE